MREPTSQCSGMALAILLGLGSRKSRAIVLGLEP